MSNHPPVSDNTYGRLTGWKRLALVVLCAISGAVVALMFSVFSGHPTPTWELIIGAIGVVLPGLSAATAALPVVRLPSTSPAAATMRPAQKLLRWRAPERALLAPGRGLGGGTLACSAPTRPRSPSTSTATSRR